MNGPARITYNVVIPDEPAVVPHDGSPPTYKPIRSISVEYVRADLFAELQAECERLKTSIASAQLAADKEMNAREVAEQKLAAIQSWKESVLAEVGRMQEHVHLRLKDFSDESIQAFVDQANEIIDSYRDRGTHIAAQVIELRAKLVEARRREIPDGCFCVQQCDTQPHMHPLYGPGVFFTESVILAQSQPQPLNPEFVPLDTEGRPLNTTRHEVMNPPESAAGGSEARNLNSANVMGLGEVHRASEARPADDVPAPSQPLPEKQANDGVLVHCAYCKTTLENGDGVSKPRNCCKEGREFDLAWHPDRHLWNDKKLSGERS